MIPASTPAEDLQAKFDTVNASFYGRFPYPPPPVSFERVREPGFWRRLVCQDVGCWDGSRLPADLRIWVAGCGTNQAVVTALKFPEARIVASDLSRPSLDTTDQSSRDLGIRNLELRQESINDAQYIGEFDLVICTGVIHHNVDPARTLLVLAGALKQSGLLELMVYNRFHRTLMRAFQEAVRTFAGTRSRPQWEQELPCGRALAHGFRGSTAMARFLAGLVDKPDALFADSLLQPIEHAYTIRSLSELASDCSLELLTFCIDRFSRAEGAIDWNLGFEDQELQKQYDGLPDEDRWEITNQMMGEASPMLWFYLQRKDSEQPRMTEQMLAKEFLRRRFDRAQTQIDVFSRSLKGTWSKAAQPSPFPGKPATGLEATRLYAAIDGTATMSDLFTALNIAMTPRSAHRLRTTLATSAFPYLVAIPNED